MVTIRNETHGDIGSREALLDRVWGAARFEKTAERLREGRTPAAGRRSSPKKTEISSVPSGYGTSVPDRRCRPCCSARSRSRRRSAAAASARP